MHRQAVPWPSFKAVPSAINLTFSAARVHVQLRNNFGAPGSVGIPKKCQDKSSEIITATASAARVGVQVGVERNDEQRRENVLSTDITIDSRPGKRAAERKRAE